MLATVKQKFEYTRVQISRPGIMTKVCVDANWTKSMEQQLIDRIYECAFAPEFWPGVLDKIAQVALAQITIQSGGKSPTMPNSTVPAIGNGLPGCNHAKGNPKH